MWPESDLIDERVHEGVRSLLADETLRVVQEDLVEAVQEILQQQATLLHILLRTKEGFVWRGEERKKRKRAAFNFTLG